MLMLQLLNTINGQQLNNFKLYYIKKVLQVLVTKILNVLKLSIKKLILPQSVILCCELVLVEEAFSFVDILDDVLLRPGLK